VCPAGALTSAARCQQPDAAATSKRMLPRQSACIAAQRLPPADARHDAARVVSEETMRRHNAQPARRRPAQDARAQRQSDCPPPPARVSQRVTSESRYSFQNPHAYQTQRQALVAKTIMPRRTLAIRRWFVPPTVHPMPE